MQKYSCFAFLIAALLILSFSSGCSSTRKEAFAMQKSLDRPDRSTEEVALVSNPPRIVMVNEDLNFVVIDFIRPSLPPAGIELEAFRGNERVGVLRMSDVAMPPMATADILEGQLQREDTIRERAR